MLTIIVPLSITDSGDDRVMATLLHSTSHVFLGLVDQPCETNYSEKKTP